MAVWLFTYEPFEGEPTSAQMDANLKAARLEVEFVQPRVWLIKGPEKLEDLNGSHSNDLMEIVGSLVAEGKRGYVIAPILSLAGKGWTGDFGGIGRMLAPGLPIGPY